MSNATGEENDWSRTVDTERSILDTRNKVKTSDSFILAEEQGHSAISTRRQCSEDVRPPYAQIWRRFILATSSEAFSASRQ